MLYLTNGSFDSLSLLWSAIVKHNLYAHIIFLLGGHFKVKNVIYFDHRSFSQHFTTYYFVFIVPLGFDSCLIFVLFLDLVFVIVLSWTLKLKFYLISLFIDTGILSAQTYWWMQVDQWNLQILGWQRFFSILRLWCTFLFLSSL